ncbi:cobalamin B12-binding domain-containing protein [Methylobacterium soli]|uniref:cobalamin B12-binding domain-containing protein n=1 Tax=Methylobacterium soli TaxID=553447 RepID=UPI001EE24241|nr:cobalamin B12-binding domain-containing protein [Methylobacterium soli]GJE44046.1 hypothetical protein AEGHOMDF_3232 [Methylobacterium soli]
MDDVSPIGGYFARGSMSRERGDTCPPDARDAQRQVRPPERPVCWHGNLARVVEAEIIPRLMLVHRARALPGTPRKPTPEEIAIFSGLVLAPFGDDVESRIAVLVEGGLSLDSLLLDLLAPTARHLGALWEEDMCDFTELTIAMGRLQRIMHDISLRYCDESETISQGRSILLGPCPGETHLFGLSMLERFFSDAGWDVTSTALDPEIPLLDRVRSTWFDVIGLSLGCEVLLPILAETVAGLRRASRNPSLRILVGGSIFVENPGYANLVGADATAVDARRAVLSAECLLDLRARAC